MIIPSHSYLIYFLECVELNIFLKDFFDVDHFLKVFIEFATILFLFYVLFFFDLETCEILAPRPGIKHTPPEGSFNYWTAREFPTFEF